MKRLFGIFLATLIFIVISVLVCLFGCAHRKEYKEYLVNYFATEGGYISGEISQRVSENGSTTPVSVNPYEGFYFKAWSDGDGHFVRSDKNVTSDITVTAIFERFICSVDYIAGLGGAIQGNCHQTVNMYDETEEVTAIPNEGYDFVGWSDGKTEATRFEASVEKNFSVTANFELKSYSVKFSASTGGAINGEVEQSVKHGYNCGAITAKPELGYVFVGWSDGVQTTTRSDTVYTDIDVTAYFERAFEGGDGSVSNPFTINNYKQFCNIVFYPAEYFKLVNDLDLTGINHKPLFEESELSSGGAQPFGLRASGYIKSFTGEFDGCGHCISNLSVNCDSQYPSLFGIIDQGFVKNLKIENAEIKTVDFDTANGKYYVGILTGVLNGFAQNVTVNGEIIVNELNHDGVAVGGIAGQAFYPMINCSANVIITANGVVSNKTGMANPFCFGGLAGVCSSWSIARCEATGTITINNSRALNPNVIDILVGGLIGYCFGSTEDSGDEIDGEDSGIRIVNSHSSVDIIENESDIKASGFISVFEIYKFEISDCLSKGDESSNIAAGFLYSVNVKTESVMENCRAEGSLVAKVRACGFVCGTITGSVNFFRCSVGGDISADAYAGGFFYTSIGAVTVKDCIVESNLTGKYACGFAYISGKNTVFERCGFNGYIQCVNGGAGICYRVSGSKILNCYSVGNIIVENAETSNDVLRVGGLCSQIFESEIANCYFAGKIKIATEYRLDSHLGKLVGYSRNSKIINCHTLHCVDDGIENVVGVSIGDANVYDIVSYANVEEMYNLADILNGEQEEIVWEKVPNDLPKPVNKTKEKIYEIN